MSSYSFFDNPSLFEDRGDNYRPVIYYFDERQKEIAEQSKANLQASGRFDRPIVTKIEPAETFYEAEATIRDFIRLIPNVMRKVALFVTNF